MSRRPRVRAARRTTAARRPTARATAARPAAPRTSPLDRCIHVADLEALAKRRMPAAHFDYYAGGAEDERTIARNRSAFDRWHFLPRVLAGTGEVRLGVTLLGAAVASPIAIAPSAYQRLAHPLGELATARAAGSAGTLMVLSTMATRSIEEVAAAASGPLWFQLYVYRDRSLTERLVARAERAGYRALVLTVDTPRLGRRERDERSRFRLPAGIPIANFDEEGERFASWRKQGSMAAYANEQLDPTLDWSAVTWLQRTTQLPIVLKGIMRADDASRACDAGVQGVWVSNHGGRQLDSEEATIHALPAVVDAVAGRAEVYVDGGFRRGTDVVKALALGARAAFIGRPCLWGLAAGGERGVSRVLDLLRIETETSMAILGAVDVGNVDRSLVLRD